MAKEIFCCIGVDVDAVAGWLGSYGGEDSPDDISRGLFAGEVGTPPPAEALRQIRPEDDLVHPGPLDRDVPRGDAAGRRRRPRDRHARLLAREPDLDDAASRRRPCSIKCIGLIEDVCGRRPTGYVAPWWEFSNVTNELLLKHGIKYDHSLMHKDFHPVLRPGRRLLDEDRLLEAAGGVDEAARPRPGDRPDRDPGELVPRRPAADDVHQGRPEQPRLRQPARTSRRSGATSSTTSTARRTTPSSR